MQKTRICLINVSNWKMTKVVSLKQTTPSVHLSWLHGPFEWTQNQVPKSCIPAGIKWLHVSLCASVRLHANASARLIGGESTWREANSHIVLLRRDLFSARKGAGRRARAKILYYCYGGWGNQKAEERERQLCVWSCFGKKEVPRGWILFRGWPPAGRDFHCPLSPPLRRERALALCWLLFATRAWIYISPFRRQILGRRIQQKRKFMDARWLLPAMNPNVARFMTR